MTDADHATAVKAAAEALARATDDAQKSGLAVDLEIERIEVTNAIDLHRRYTFTVHVAVSRPL